MNVFQQVFANISPKSTDLILKNENHSPNDQILEKRRIMKYDDPIKVKPKSKTPKSIIPAQKVQKVDEPTESTSKQITPVNSPSTPDSDAPESRELGENLEQFKTEMDSLKAINIDLNEKTNILAKNNTELQNELKDTLEMNNILTSRLSLMETEFFQKRKDLEEKWMSRINEIKEKLKALA